MRHILCAGVAAVSLCTAMPRPAEAWGGGVLFGTAVGLTAGTIIGSTIARPYGYGYYPYGYYPAYGYPYAYPPPLPYPPAYGYAYPPPVGYPPGYQAYAPPGYPPAPAPSYANQPGGYASSVPAPAPASRSPSCQSGQFFNTLTGSCDRR